MQEIIRPNNINEIMQVDRNDIYWNMKSIFNACDAVGNIKYNTDYYGGYDYGFGDSEEEKRNKEENYARIQEIWCIIDRYKRRLDSKKEELQRIYDTKIIPYENLDDEYGRKASDLYSNYSSFGEALWDGISSCITDVVDIIKGIEAS